MKLTLTRFESLSESTIGKLVIEGSDIKLFTLERKSGLCIPAGIYSIAVNFSGRFQRMMPQILNVPGYEGIRIHPGNTQADTEGCVLVGEDWMGQQFICRSRDAFDQLFALLDGAKEPVVIEILEALGS